MNYDIPRRTLDSLRSYADNKRQTGHFLHAVLTNDLFETTARADVDSRAALFDICMYIYNEMPSSCWGSKEIVEKWLKG